MRDVADYKEGRIHYGKLVIVKNPEILGKLEVMLYGNRGNTIVTSPIVVLDELPVPDHWRIDTLDLSLDYNKRIWTFANRPAAPIDLFTEKYKTQADAIEAAKTWLLSVWRKDLPDLPESFFQELFVYGFAEYYYMRKAWGNGRRRHGMDMLPYVGAIDYDREQPNVHVTAGLRAHINGLSEGVDPNAPEVGY